MSQGLNFARAPFTNERLPRLVFLLLALLVGAVTLVHGYFLTGYLLREQEELDIRVGEVRDEIRKTDEAIATTQSSLSREQSAAGNERTAFLTSLYRQKSFSWTGLFNELEAITPGAVRVTSITPTEEKGEITVTMTIVGRTLQDILEMVRALESSSFFATVFPVDESSVEKPGEADAGIAATLRLHYVEEARPRSESSPAAEQPAESDEDDEPSGPTEEEPQ
jgi:Tfp pilus assembly protein PilN